MRRSTSERSSANSTETVEVVLVAEESLSPNATPRFSECCPPASEPTEMSARRRHEWMAKGLFERTPSCGPNASSETEALIQAQARARRISLSPAAPRPAPALALCLRGPGPDAGESEQQESPTREREGRTARGGVHGFSGELVFIGARSVASESRATAEADAARELQPHAEHTAARQRTRDQAEEAQLGCILEHAAPPPAFRGNLSPLLLYGKRTHSIVREHILL